jgi:hypothetical protein
MLGLLAVVVLLAGIVPPTAAAADRDRDGSKIEPALARALAAKPNATFEVIITRQVAKDR